ncbi:hypothetical protein NpNSSI1_00012125 [Neofusicoccum parvum]|nr:hypothetical protein NpNSSI1_00012125 [Neofusicoccum parvum]
MPIATALSRFSPLAPLRRRRQSPRQSSSSETGGSLDEKSPSPSSPSPLSGSERSYEMRTISARKARVLLPQQQQAQSQSQRQKRPQQQKKQRPSALTTAQTGGEAERVWKEFWI